LKHGVQYITVYHYKIADKQKQISEIISAHVEGDSIRSQMHTF